MKALYLTALLTTAVVLSPAKDVVTGGNSNTAAAEEGCLEYKDYLLVYAGPGAAFCYGAGTGCKICVRAE
jgi:hypothetical protein